METSIKRSPGRPKDAALQERRREEILDRAVGLFAEHGYRNTDLQWVADALGVSKGTIYRYFPSKESLFLEAVRRGVNQLFDVVDRAKDDAPDARSFFAAGIRAYLRFFREHPQLVELFIQERAEFRDRGRPIYFESRDPRRAPLLAKITRFMDEGQLRRMPVERAVDIVGEMLYGSMFITHVSGLTKSVETEADDILDILFHGILSNQECPQQLCSAEDGQI